MPTSQTPSSSPDQGQWHGIPRQDIPWFPTIDEKACINCGLCYVTCGRLVFEMDEEKRKAVVVEPYRCMVGCTTCGNICPTEAIAFPERSTVQKIEREHKILKLVREETKAKKAKVALDKARAKAVQTVSAIAPQVEFEVAGDFGDKRFMMQLYDFVKERDCDIVQFVMENPTLKGTLGGKAPSHCRFRLVSECYENIDPYVRGIHELIQRNGLVLTNERKV
jgi:NAD-dependent dihydropyrimidine dehydrogenase PreA subunit